LTNPFRSIKSTKQPQRHPLDAAIDRAERANLHIHEFASGRRALLKIARDHLITEYNPQTLQITGQVLTVHVPPIASIIVGEVIYNLRAALDYLVFELARYDSGKVQDGTQFLVEDVRSDPANKNRGFIPRSKSCLKGVSSDHIDLIEKLQPYNGVDWTKTLRDISNPDKHRELIAMKNSGPVHIKLTGGEPGSFKGKPGKVYPGAGKDGCDLYLEAEDATDIAFPDERLVLPILELLQKQVADTINAFKPEFKV
jgi:hypothetical protein